MDLKELLPLGKGAQRRIGSHLHGGAALEPTSDTQADPDPVAVCDRHRSLVSGEAAEYAAGDSGQSHPGRVIWVDADLYALGLRYGSHLLDEVCEVVPHLVL